MREREREVIIRYRRGKDGGSDLMLSGLSKKELDFTSEAMLKDKSGDILYFPYYSNDLIPIT